MTTCPPECWASEQLHCYQHCPNCQTHTLTQAALSAMFERYLASRPNPEHTRTWNRDG